MKRPIPIARGGTVRILTGLVAAMLLMPALLAAGGAGSVGQSPAQQSDTDLVGRIMVAFGVDEGEVRSCIAHAMATSSERRAEFRRLDAVLEWLNRSKPKETAQAFAELVAGFTHERRLDGIKLAAITDGALGPRDVTTYARVVRALGNGRDPRRVLCGL